jgi:Protein of unknown function (DUF3168)
VANDFTLDARRAVIARLTGNVSGANLYGEGLPDAPEWPFVLVSPGIAIPDDPSGFDGSSIRVTCHCFARGVSADAALTLNGVVAQRLDGAEVETDDSAPVSIAWEGSPQAIKDDDGWHAVSDYRVDIIAVTT